MGTCDGVVLHHPPSDLSRMMCMCTVVDCITKFLTSKISHLEKFTYKKTHLCIKKLVSTVGNGRGNEGTFGECRKIIQKCFILHRK
jgi:hypothetical protein